MAHCTTRETYTKAGRKPALRVKILLILSSVQKSVLIIGEKQAIIVSDVIIFGRCAGRLGFKLCTDYYVNQAAVQF